MEPRSGSITPSSHPCGNCHRISAIPCSYWRPTGRNNWPGQERDLHTSRRNLNKRLRELEDYGLIVGCHATGGAPFTE
jgi:hypothetical protein